MPEAPSPRPLRVLMVGPLPPPVGGMAAVVANLVAALGDEVDLRVLNNVKTTAADRRLWAGVGAQLRLMSRLAAACVGIGGWRADLVHIHTCSWFTFWRNGVDVLVVRLLGRPVVLHIHGGQFATFLDGLSPLRAWAVRRLLRLCARVLVLGTGWKGLLDQWADPGRVLVVSNGVPIPVLAGTPTPSGPEAGRGPWRVVCLANYAPAKGQADLLRAVAQLAARDVRPVMIELLGFETEPGQRQALLDLAVSLGIAEAVQIPGPVTGDAKYARLAAADCFCLPSYDEGLPMSMLEAMAAAVPVVVTAVGAVPEAVADGAEGLLFAPGDIDGLALHLQRLRDDPADAAALGRAGRARVEREFSLARSAGQVLALWRALTAPRAPRRPRR